MQLCTVTFGPNVRTETFAAETLNGLLNVMEGLELLVNETTIYNMRDRFQVTKTGKPRADKQCKRMASVIMYRDTIAAFADQCGIVLEHAMKRERMAFNDLIYPANRVEKCWPVVPVLETGSITGLATMLFNAIKQFAADEYLNIDSDHSVTFEFWTGEHPLFADEPDEEPEPETESVESLGGALTNAQVENAVTALGEKARELFAEAGMQYVVSSTLFNSDVGAITIAFADANIDPDAARKFYDEMSGGSDLGDFDEDEDEDFFEEEEDDFDAPGVNPEAKAEELDTLPLRTLNKMAERFNIENQFPRSKARTVQTLSLQLTLEQIDEFSDDLEEASTARAMSNADILVEHLNLKGCQELALAFRVLTHDGCKRRTKLEMMKDVTAIRTSAEIEKKMRKLKLPLLVNGL